MEVKMKKILLSLLCLAVHAADDGMYFAGGYGTKQMQDMFERVKFSVPNVLIYAVESYVGSGDLTVAFGSGKHLEESIQRCVIIDAGTVTYQYDPSATAFTLRKCVGQMSIGRTILIEGVAGMKMSGHVRGEKGAVVYVPRKTDVSGLLTCNADLKPIPSVEDRLALAAIYNSHSYEVLASMRTIDAELLMAQITTRENSVSDHPGLLKAFHPGFVVLSDADVKYRCTQAIASSSGLVVRAPSASDLKTYLSKFNLHEPIRVIDGRSKSDLISVQPMTIINWDQISSDGILIVMGSYTDRAGKLSLNGEKGVLMLSSSLLGGYGTSIDFGGFVHKADLEQIGMIDLMKLLSLPFYTKLLDKIMAMGIIDQENYDKLLKRRKTLDEENGEMKLALEDALASSSFGRRRS
jgi:hypothetical protein